MLVQNIILEKRIKLFFKENCFINSFIFKENEIKNNRIRIIINKERGL